MSIEKDIGIALRAKCGEGGIRTLEAPYETWSVSTALHSTTMRPPRRSPTPEVESIRAGLVRREVTQSCPVAPRRCARSRRARSPPASGLQGRAPPVYARARANDRRRPLLGARRAVHRCDGGYPSSRDTVPPTAGAPAELPARTRGRDPRSRRSSLAPRAAVSAQPRSARRRARPDPARRTDQARPRGS